MSAEQQGNVEALPPHGTCPINSILSSEQNTRTFLDDENLPYLQNAYLLPLEDVDQAEQVRDRLNDPANLKAYGQSILNEAYRWNELIDQARCDSLTGLPKGEVWLEGASEAVLQCEISGGEEWLAVLFIDLSGFKLVNDKAGHPVGDVLLQNTAKGLRKYTRPEDRAAILGRMGGDEFAVLLRFDEKRIPSIPKELNREERTASAAERIAGLLDAMLAESLDEMSAEDPRLKGLVVTAVTGYATWQPGMTAEEVLKAADAAMNEAKGKIKQADHKSLTPEEQAEYERGLRIFEKIGFYVDPRDGVLKRR